MGQEQTSRADIIPPCMHACAFQRKADKSGELSESTTHTLENFFYFYDLKIYMTKAKHFYSMSEHSGFVKKKI